MLFGKPDIAHCVDTVLYSKTQYPLRFNGQLIDETVFDDDNGEPYLKVVCFIDQDGRIILQKNTLFFDPGKGDYCLSNSKYMVVNCKKDISSFERWKSGVQNLQYVAWVSKIAKILTGDEFYLYFSIEEVLASKGGDSHE